MKKILKTIIISNIIAIILLANLAIVSNATSTIDCTQSSLEQHLIGTWRWEYQHSWIIVFREDGTMLDGTPLLRTNHNWEIVNDRLFVDGDDWNIRTTANTITVDRLGSTYTYIWYSDSTEGGTSHLIVFIIIGTIAVIGIIVFTFVRRSRRKRQEMWS